MSRIEEILNSNASSFEELINETIDKLVGQQELKNCVIYFKEIMEKVSDVEKKAYRIAIEAIEKQIAIPSEIVSGKESCPNCGVTLNDSPYTYCEKCGQHEWRHRS